LPELAPCGALVALSLLLVDLSTQVEAFEDWAFGIKKLDVFDI
jgi:hypothetical protein